MSNTTIRNVSSHGHDGPLSKTVAQHMLAGSLLGSLQLPLENGSPVLSNEWRVSTLPWREEHGVFVLDSDKEKPLIYYNDLQVFSKYDVRTRSWFDMFTIPILELYEVRFHFYSFTNPEKSSHSKVISKKILEYFYSYEGLAAWFMDDSFEKTSNGYNVCVNSFSPDEVAILVDILHSYKIFNTSLISINGGRFININTESAEELRNSIRPYVHPNLKYKL